MILVPLDDTEMNSNVSMERCKCSFADEGKNEWTGRIMGDIKGNVIFLFMI